MIALSKHIRDLSTEVTMEGVYFKTGEFRILSFVIGFSF